MSYLPWAWNTGTPPAVAAGPRAGQTVDAASVLPRHRGNPRQDQRAARTTRTGTRLETPGIAISYKNLYFVERERDFRHINVDDISVRPIHQRLEAPVRAHVFIRVLASYLV